MSSIVTISRSLYKRQWTQIIADLMRMRRRVKGRSEAQIWQLQFFGHPLSLPLSLRLPLPVSRYKTGCSKLHEDPAEPLFSSTPSPFLPLPLVTTALSSPVVPQRRLDADRATNIKFEINKSKQFSRPSDMRGKRAGRVVPRRVEAFGTGRRRTDSQVESRPLVI